MQDPFAIVGIEAGAGVRVSQNSLQYLDIGVVETQGDDVREVGLDRADIFEIRGGGIVIKGVQISAYCAGGRCHTVVGHVVD